MTQKKKIYADNKFNYMMILFFIFVTSVVSQEKSIENDSLINKNSILFEEPLTLQSIDQLQLPVGFFSNFTRYPELEFLKLAQDVSANNPPDFKLIQNDLLRNFKQSMEWKENYNLGVFGKYLGYAMSAAAVGLAATSIAKYGKDYFGNKKRIRKK
jgi:hypothetical protein